MSPPRLCCRLLSCPWLSLWTWLFQVLGDVVTHLSLGNVTPLHPAHRQGGDPRDRSTIQAADSTKLASSCVSVFNNRSKEAAPLAPIPAPRKHLWHAAFIQQSSWSMLNLKSIVPTPLRSGVHMHRSLHFVSSLRVKWVQKNPVLSELFHWWSMRETLASPRLGSEKRLEKVSQRCFKGWPVGSC